MKILMTKHQMQRWCQDYEQELLESAGWHRADVKELAEVVRLKPPVKSKGTVKLSLDNANQQGDE
jgi:hypothetical protein